MLQSPGRFHIAVFAILTTLTNHTPFQFMGDQTFEKKCRVDDAG